MGEPIENAVIIAGSRSIKDYELVVRVIERAMQADPIFCPTLVISGGAIGVDRLGERWARENGIHIIQFLPDYDRYGAKRAPAVRNRQMVQRCNSAICAYDGRSPGTRMLIEMVYNCGKTPYIAVEP